MKSGNKFNFLVFARPMVLRRPIIALLSLLLILNSLFFIPNQARAQLATIEANATVYLPVIAGANTVQSTLATKKSILEIAFGALKKRIFDLMADQIIDYINGSGKPQFITDWRGFFDTVGQIAVGDLVQQLGLGALCSPYRLQIQLAMIAPPRFSKQITCTLGTILHDVDNFYKDFRNGGWIAYQEMWAPNNNFYGSLLLAWNAKENEVAARLQAAGNEALASRGFLSVKKCLKDANGRDIPSTCVITTPGTAVGALAEKAISSDLDFIINSQDLAVYVSAISDALLNRMIRAGVEGLGGITTPTVPRGYAGGVGCYAFVGKAQEDCLNYQSSYGQSYTSPSQYTPEEINRALQPRQQAQAIIDNLSLLEQAVIDKLNSLLNCQLTKNQDASQTRLLLTEHQQKLNGYRQDRYQNQYAIDQLINASRPGAFLDQSVINDQRANQFLAAYQTEQANQQSFLINLANELQTKINQCRQ